MDDKFKHYSCAESKLSGGTFLTFCDFTLAYPDYVIHF